MTTWKTTVTADTQEMFYTIIIEKGEKATITAKVERINEE